MGRTRGGWTEKNKIVEEERLGNKKMDKGEYTRQEEGDMGRDEGGCGREPGIGFEVKE